MGLVSVSRLERRMNYRKLNSLEILSMKVSLVAYGWMYPAS